VVRIFPGYLFGDNRSAQQSGQDAVEKHLHDTGRLRIFRWHEEYATGSCIYFPDPATVLRFLQPFASDPFHMRYFRETLSEELQQSDIARLDDAGVLRRLSAVIAAGRLRIAEAAPPEIRTPARAAASEPPPRREEKPPAPLPPRQGNWIIFRVLDEASGKPQVGVQMKIKLPSGVIADFTTDSRGLIEIQRIPAGTCEIEHVARPENLEVVKIE